MYIAQVLCVTYIQYMFASFFDCSFNLSLCLVRCLSTDSEVLDCVIAEKITHVSIVR